MLFLRPACQNSSLPEGQGPLPNLQSISRLPVLWSSGGAVSWNYTSTVDLQQASRGTPRPADKSYYVGPYWLSQMDSHDELPPAHRATDLYRRLL